MGFQPNPHLSQPWSFAAGTVGARVVRLDETGSLSRVRADASGDGQSWVGVSIGTSALVGFNGRAVVLRESTIGVLAPGTLVYLSTSVWGAVTPTPTTASGTWHVPVGIVVSPSADGDPTVTVLLRFEAPFVVS